MLCMHSLNTDPYYNLALEEYLLKKFTDDFFILWQSEPVVVAGKHQNVLAEMNYRFVKDNGILVARRLTGGGTVYHDAGNINFTFIRNGESGKLVDFTQYIKPVTGFLQSLGIDARQGLKNEILVDGKKISGNAEHVYKNRVLHHGTLLYKSDLGFLGKAITREKGKYIDKAVQSNRSRVANLSQYVARDQDITVFMKSFMEYISINCQGRYFDIQQSVQVEIEQLAQDKYKTWEWIYGWSPDYEFENVWQRGGMAINLYLKTHRGNITACNLEASGISRKILDAIQNRLTGLPHEEMRIAFVLSSSELDQLFKGFDLNDLVMAFF